MTEDQRHDHGPTDLGRQPPRGAQGRPHRRQRGIPRRVRRDRPTSSAPSAAPPASAARPASAAPPRARARPARAPSAAPVSYAGVTLNNSTGGYSIPAFQIGLDAWKAETGGNATFNNIPFDEKPVKYASFIATQDSSWDLHYTYDNYMQKFGTRLLLPLEGNYTGDLTRLHPDRPAGLHDPDRPGPARPADPLQLVAVDLEPRAVHRDRRGRRQSPGHVRGAVRADPQVRREEDHPVRPALAGHRRDVRPALLDAHLQLDRPPDVQR